jgi:hypothetical protein
VRCYATEDANPTKQLKNKLSQAAAAQGGLLVLLLIDEESHLKAREALLERWMKNPEWPKSVACVALAYPLTAPTIATLVERVSSPWAKAVQTLLFPSAELARISAEDNTTTDVLVVCPECGSDLPAGARFCSNCGRRLSA